MNQSFEIILGSASMARRQILSEMGYEFTIMKCYSFPQTIWSLFETSKAAKQDLFGSADIDEKSIRKETPEDLVMALAEAKVVVYEGIIREKPSSREEARQFIKDYSGGSARVVGSVVVTNLVTGGREGGWESAEVYFHAIPDDIIDSLLEEGIILNVAGGLMLEHPLTLPLVDTVIGTCDCVMGLSKSLTEKLIQEAL